MTFAVNLKTLLAKLKEAEQKIEDQKVWVAGRPRRGSHRLDLRCRELAFRKVLADCTPT